MADSSHSSQGATTPSQWPCKPLSVQLNAWVRRQVKNLARNDIFHCAGRRRFATVGSWATGYHYAVGGETMQATVLGKSSLAHATGIARDIAEQAAQRAVKQLLIDVR